MTDSTTNYALKKAVDADNAREYLRTDLAGSLDDIDGFLATLFSARTVDMVNNSGGSLAAGDVVIIDTSLNNAVTTTSSAGSALALGAALEAIANGATGKIAITGSLVDVSVNGTTNRGDWIATSTTVKQGKPSATDPTAAFARAVASRTGAGLVKCLLIGPLGQMVTETGTQTLANKTLTSPVLNTPNLPVLTTAEDLLVGTGSGGVKRLAVGANNKLLAVASGALAWKDYIQLSGLVTISSSPTTTSGSFVDLTGASITMTTTGGVVLLLFTGYASANGTNHQTHFAFDYDGTTTSINATAFTTDGTAEDGGMVMMFFPVTGLSAASHTFKVKWANVGGSTSKLDNGHALGRFYAMELQAAA